MPCEFISRAKQYSLSSTVLDAFISFITVQCKLSTEAFSEEEDEDEQEEADDDTLAVTCETGFPIPDDEVVLPLVTLMYEDSRTSIAPAVFPATTHLR
jgi:hypothetical protein